MEWEVIRGGLGWLNRSGYPPILFEVGDYMPKQIPKRQALFDLLKQQGYDCFVHGELCIAQHHTNRYLDFIFNNNRLHSIHLLK